VLLTASTASAASITVFTDISGANTQIDSSNWTVWTFSLVPTPGNSVEDILGSFVIKRGNSTNKPITFSLFGTDATAWSLATISATSPIASFVLDESDVSTSYGTELFPLNPTPDLTATNIVYSLVLWSETGTNGAYQYFFKGQDTTLLVTPCGVISGNHVQCDSNNEEFEVASTPEPSTIVLMLTGVGAAIGLKRRRRS
jgi:hypothetical protein